jgi:GTPase SAR1 family protein
MMIFFENFLIFFSFFFFFLFFLTRDTAGQEGFKRIRTLSYPETDVFLLCYAVDNKQSYDNIPEHWHKEVEQHCPGTPKLLVALKVDLRASTDGALSEDDGKQMAEQIGAAGYMECSAKTREGLEQVFLQARDIALQNKKDPVSVSSSGSSSGDSKQVGKSGDKKDPGCVLQ